MNSFEQNVSPVNICLLDDFMEQGVVTSDISLGDALNYKQDSATEGIFELVETSPSHESISGDSGMNSPTYSYTSSMSDDHEQRFDVFSDIGDELCDYLSSANTSPIPDPDLLGFICDEKNNNNEEMETVDVDSVIDTSIDTNPKVMRVNISAGKTEHVKKQEIEPKIVKPITRSSPNPVPVQAPTTSLKVIKVIKTPVTSSQLETEKQILDALDDRNKKNAVQAKINREKKKAYIKTLEDDVASLQSENVQLKNQNEEMKLSQDELLEEVAYLKSVLANQSSLSSLLKSIPNATNVNLQNFSRKRSAAELDHDYPTQKCAKINEAKVNTAGVCLHVDSDNISIEFCSHCSKSSKSLLKS